MQLGLNQYGMAYTLRFLSLDRSNSFPAADMTKAGARAR